jgi:hypothetical protein
MAVSAPLSLPRKIAFPDSRYRCWRRLSSNARSVRRKAENLVLLRPFGRQLGETGNAHAVRESAFNGRFDEIGCEKGKRDRHVYFADATVLMLRD